MKEHDHMQRAYKGASQTAWIFLDLMKIRVNWPFKTNTNILFLSGIHNSHVAPLSNHSEQAHRQAHVRHWISCAPLQLRIQWKSWILAIMQLTAKGKSTVVSEAKNQLRADLTSAVSLTGHSSMKWQSNSSSKTESPYAFLSYSAISLNLFSLPNEIHKPKRNSKTKGK